MKNILLVCIGLFLFIGCGSPTPPNSELDFLTTYPKMDNFKDGKKIGEREMTDIEKGYYDSVRNAYVSEHYYEM